MKKENASDKIEEYIQSQKASFRRRQRNLPFTEKMQIALALAERDKTIHRAVLLPKQKRKTNNLPLPNLSTSDFY